MSEGPYRGGGGVTDERQKLRQWFEERVEEDEARFPTGEYTKQVIARRALLDLLTEAEERIKELEAWQRFVRNADSDLAFMADDGGEP